MPNLDYSTLWKNDITLWTKKEHDFLWTMIENIISAPQVSSETPSPEQPNPVMAGSFSPHHYALTNNNSTQSVNSQSFFSTESFPWKNSKNETEQLQDKTLQNTYDCSLVSQNLSAGLWVSHSLYTSCKHR